MNDDMERIRESVLEIDQCWVWQKFKSTDGYGRMFYRGSSGWMAHRVSYELTVGPIPAGMEIDHRCRNRSCVRPDHLEVVTHEENMRRRPTPEVKTLCRNGHEQGEANTRETVRPNGHTHRACRSCEAAATQRYKNRKKGLSE